MSDIDINRVLQNIGELQDQNAIDFQQWKRLGQEIERLERKIKTSDTHLNLLMKKIKADYEKLKEKIIEDVEKIKDDYNSLKKIIVDENVQVQLNNKIEENKSEINKKVNKETFDNSMKSINEQLDTKATKTEVDVERKRIDLFTSLPDGSTSGDAELIDARLNDIGEKSSNVGENIRNSLSIIRNNTTINLDKIKFKLGGIVTWSGEDETEINNKRCKSTMLKNNKNDVIYSINNTPFWVALFDENLNFKKISDLWLTSYKFESDGYFRIVAKKKDEIDLTELLDEMSSNFVFNKNHSASFSLLKNDLFNSDNLLVTNNSFYKTTYELKFLTDNKGKFTVKGTETNTSAKLIKNASITLENNQVYTIKTDIIKKGENPIFLDLYDIDSNKAVTRDSLNIFKITENTFKYEGETKTFYIGLNGRKDTVLDCEFYIYISKNANKGLYNYVKHEKFEEFKNEVKNNESVIYSNVNMLNNSVNNIDVGVTVKFSDFKDDTSTDSEIMDKILEYTSKFKQRTITIDENINIDKAILLPSNTTIIIDNCTIKQNDEVFDNVFRGGNVVLSTWDLYYVPTNINYFYNIKILGKGNARIEGCSVNKKHTDGTTMTGDKWGGRTHMINMSCIKGFELGGIEFNKTRGWCVELEFVRDFYVHDLVVNSQWVKNGDGIDVRAGCQNGMIERISGATGDDTIAINSHIRNDLSYPINNNFIYPNEFTYKYNIEGRKLDPYFSEIKNISIKDITKEGGQYHAIIILSMFGHKISNISIDNFKLSGDIALPWTNSYIAFYNYIPSDAPNGDSVTKPIEDDFTKGDITNIRFNNIECNCITDGMVLYSNLELDNTWANKIVQKNTNALITNINQEGFTLTN